MIDDDTVPPLGTLSRLLNAKEDIVVVDTPSKVTGKSNIFQNKNGEIVASGFSCALFTRRVFETIPGPWFDLAPRRSVKKRNQNYIFQEVIGDANGWGGEDINFSIKARDHGFKIKKLDGVQCTHLDYQPFTSENRAVQVLNIERYEELNGPPL